MLSTTHVVADDNAERIENRVHRRSRRAGSRGFTLVELLFGLTIATLLVLAVLHTLGNRWNARLLGQAQVELTALAIAIEDYRQLHPESCPGSPVDLVHAGLLERIGADPWGRPYRIECEGPLAAAHVASAGPDGVHGTSDDLSRWIAAPAGAGEALERAELRDRAQR